MAHFCHAQGTSAISAITASAPSVFQIGLWGGGPAGEDLVVIVQGSPILKVTFLGEAATPHVRIFEVTTHGFGHATLEARVPGTGASFAAPLRVTVVGGTDETHVDQFYHGTSLEQAKKVMTMDLVPFAVPEPLLLDVNEFTDFGKGFYTHPEESKTKAVEWAKRRNQDWGVVRFGLQTSELSEVMRLKAPLYFPDKFRTRPLNAPILFAGQRASWIEFVEFNRHVKRQVIQRPKDNDWTADYGWIRGPIWGRADSKLPGAPGLPERYHQINWGLAGLQVLNRDAIKRRRFLFTKHNEHLL